MTKVDGSVALVTGAAGGIGSAIADAGAEVVRTDLAGADDRADDRQGHAQGDRQLV